MLFDPKYSALAITCSLEHFTAILAEVLLTTAQGQSFLNKLSPSHRTIWIWHAIEETEHKAVAFDVYQAVGGSNIFRVYRHLVTSFMFILTVIQLYLWLMKDLGLLYDYKQHMEVYRFLFEEPGFLRLAWPLWCKYCSFSYHPWGGRESHEEQYQSNTRITQAISYYLNSISLNPTDASNTTNNTNIINTATKRNASPVRLRKVIKSPASSSPSRKRLITTHVPFTTSPANQRVKVRTTTNTTSKSNNNRRRSPAPTTAH